MDSILNTIITLFSLLTDNTIFSIPILVWFLIPLFFGIVISFMKGDKKS